MKLKFFLNAHKGVTGLAVLALMAAYGLWENTTAWVYLALHGTYGLLWNLKSLAFPDKAWEQRVGWPVGIGAWAALSLYWVAPWLLTSRGVTAPPWLLALCISLYTFGVFLHFSADMQKHTALALNPGHLIQDGLFARCRNINYFGELLIYLGFGLLAMHWLPVAILGILVLAGWVPRMVAKDRSLSRYPDFEAYKQQSSLFLPFLI